MDLKNGVMPPACRALWAVSPSSRNRSSDLLHSLVQSTTSMLISADADAVSGAEYRAPSEWRKAQWLRLLALGDSAWDSGS
jgi:hypothetical protein